VLTLQMRFCNKLRLEENEEEVRAQVGNEATTGDPGWSWFNTVSVDFSLHFSW